MHIRWNRKETSEKNNGCCWRNNAFYFQLFLLVLLFVFFPIIFFSLTNKFSDCRYYHCCSGRRTMKIKKTKLYSYQISQTYVLLYIPMFMSLILYMTNYFYVFPSCTRLSLQFYMLPNSVTIIIILNERNNYVLFFGFKHI